MGWLEFDGKDGRRQPCWGGWVRGIEFRGEVEWMSVSPLTVVRAEIAAAGVEDVALRALARANGNASGNTYLHLEAAEVMAQAAGLTKVVERPALYGVPVSLKDCFDLVGTVTTCGSRFYARVNGVAGRDSAVAERVKAAGCVVMGKTHLHPLAYGITGQNAEYGDCLQPRDAGALTGGSSSGAAASVQEGSAVAAIGTDTGGSVRVPAALCGLVGFRCSQVRGTAAGAWPEMWRGGAHLAASFDTLGLLLRDARDAGELVGGLLGVTAATVRGACRIGCVAESFLGDCEADVMVAYRAWKAHLERAGAVLTEFGAEWWEGAMEIFAGIQAHEAAELHQGHFGEFEAGIGQRLRWGASLTKVDLAELRGRREEFCARMTAAMAGLDLVMLPCAPVSRLEAGVDAGAVRQRILRYTVPVSLAGMPAMALPGEMLGAGVGTGVQLAGRVGADAEVLGWMGWIAESLRGEAGVG